MPDALASSATLPSAHANRHAWALEKYGHLLAEALCKDTSAEAREVEKLPLQQIPAHLVSLILGKADPTQNKGMTAWLVGQYAQEKLRLEDLGTANETLAMFRRYAQRLNPTKRDLGQYSNLAAVWETVIGFANDEEQRLSGKAQKALDRDKAYAESRILRQDEDGFTIAVPLTEFAAKWWGKGTRWCTAADKDNQFRHYHETAPLFVVNIPAMGAHGKFQFWVTERIFQIMDATDQPIATDIFDSYWAYLAPLMNLLLEKNGRLLAQIPKKFRTSELCEKALGQTPEVLYYIPLSLHTSSLYELLMRYPGWSLASVPSQLRTKALCDMAVRRRGLDLEHVPASLQNSALCCAAVEQEGMSLKFVPNFLRTHRLYEIALKQNGRALSCIPEELRSSNLCDIAVHQAGMALQHVPTVLRTEELVQTAARTAVEKDGWNLAYFPETAHTAEICDIAVRHNGRALKLVASHLITETLCTAAVRQNGIALEHVPAALCTPEICQIAVEQDPWALEFVPKKFCTIDLCKMAVIRHPRTLMHVPKKFAKQELFETLVQSRGIALKSVPERYRTGTICRMAVEQDARALVYVPEALLTNDLLEPALGKNGRLLEYIPEFHKTKTNCRIAVEQNGLALEHVAFPLKSVELCRIAVNDNGLALEHVPWVYRDRELCTLAIAQNARAWFFVPEAIRCEFEHLVTSRITSWDHAFLDRAAQELQPTDLVILEPDHV